jgi:hypothetical protein
MLSKNWNGRDKNCLNKINSGLISDEKTNVQIYVGQLIS